jgi:peptidoglycan/xylan/chitin deacetylase (PgdA/CDA1 family)
MLGAAAAQQQAPVQFAATPSGLPPAPAAATATCPGNPNALGVARTVEIDTTEGPGFGKEHFNMHDFLRQGEVVLTFDDGPWQTTTPHVLAALAAHCTKATFFPIGKHATYYPEILKQVAAAGHTIGNHTWSHKDLSKKPYDTDVEAAKVEIEMGVSAVQMAVGGPVAPFFRFPALRHPPDFDSFDFTLRRPEQVVQSVMNRLKKHGKGIVLMHDFQQPTAKALPDLLNELKAQGYKIVHMRAKDSAKTLAQYDELVRKEQKLPAVSARPTATVVRTVEGN